MAPNGRLQYNPACIQNRRDSIDIEAIIHRSQMQGIHNNMPLQGPQPCPPEVLAIARPVIPQNNTAALSIPPTINLPKVSFKAFLI